MSLWATCFRSRAVAPSFTNLSGRVCQGTLSAEISTPEISQGTTDFKRSEISYRPSIIYSIVTWATSATAIGQTGGLSASASVCCASDQTCLPSQDAPLTAGVYLLTTSSYASNQYWNPPRRIESKHHLLHLPQESESRRLN